MKLTHRLKKETGLFRLFSGLAVLSPLIALIVPWMPEEETLCSWFQRSGSIMVVFALLAETTALRFQKALFPKSAFSNKEVEAARKTYWKHPAIMNSSAFLLIAIGTFIWGYGDILVKNAL